MISAIIIETPLVDFYYSFKHHNNIMFVEITEKLLYTEHIFTKLYYCLYDEFITKTNWFDFYKLSLINSKPINNNTEMIVNVFWCLYNKVYILQKAIHQHNFLQSLLFFRPYESITNYQLVIYLPSSLRFP